MHKGFQQVGGYTATVWGAIWSGWSWLADHPLTWWVSILTCISLLITIKNQIWPKKESTT